MTIPPPDFSHGYLIAIEGIDGTGKSTLARALGAELERLGLPVVLSREPTDGPFGRRIREIARSGRDDVTPRQEADLFIADRREHVEELILPSLNLGKIVILDRYFYSNVAYQGARGVDVLDLLARNRAFAPEADLLVLLRLDVEAALDRVRNSRGDAPDHFEAADQLRTVSLIFDHLDHPNLLALDANLPTSELVAWIVLALQPDQASSEAPG